MVRCSLQGSSSKLVQWNWGVWYCVLQTKTYSFWREDTSSRSTWWLILEKIKKQIYLGSQERFSLHNKRKLVGLRWSPPLAHLRCHKILWEAGFPALRSGGWVADSVSASTTASLSRSTIPVSLLSLMSTIKILWSSYGPKYCNGHWG